MLSHNNPNNLLLSSIIIVLFRSKKQYIWRFKIGESYHTVELFNSKMSKKKKVMVNGTLKAEMKV